MAFGNDFEEEVSGTSGGGSTYLRICDQIISKDITASGMSMSAQFKLKYVPPDSSYSISISSSSGTMIWYTICAGSSTSANTSYATGTGTFSYADVNGMTNGQYRNGTTISWTIPFGQTQFAVRIAHEKTVGADNSSTLYYTWGNGNIHHNTLAKNYTIQWPIVWIYYNNKWCRAIPYIYYSNKWYPAMVYVYNGGWKNMNSAG